MSEEPRYEECFVAYLDILGFKDEVKKTKVDISLLKELVDVLSINSAFTKSDGKKSTSDGRLDIRGFFLSDTFVFVARDEKKNLSHLLFIIRFLQDVLWRHKLCFRGAITKGKMYWPNVRDNILLGPAAIEAYLLESQNAIYPRVVLSERVQEYVEDKEVEFWNDEGSSVPLREFIKRDKDGIFFFDLLNSKILRKNGEKITTQKTEGHETFSILYNPLEKSSVKEIWDAVNAIVEKPDLKTENLKVRQKCEWLKNYLEESRRGY